MVPENYGEFQGLYLDRRTNWLRPNLRFVDHTGTTYFDTNELGLKGDPIDPSRKLAVVWGDSVVFGHGTGWPSLIDGLAPGHQFMNGGIEGNSYKQVLERAIALNRRRPVELNVLVLGWHHRGINGEIRRDLKEALPQIRNPVLTTMPTCLNRQAVEQDLAPYIDAEGWWAFFPPLPYSKAMAAEIFAHILERNQIIRETAAEMHVPLVDLFAAFDTSGSENFRTGWFDIPHPRQSLYPKLAEAVYEGIRHQIG